MSNVFEVGKIVEYSEGEGEENTHYAKIVEANGGDLVLRPVEKYDFNIIKSKRQEADLDFYCGPIGLRVQNENGEWVDVELKDKRVLMKRQNFIRMIAKSNSEEYGPKLTDFEVDSLLMTLENHGFDVNKLFGLEDGEDCSYIDIGWNDEKYLAENGNYHKPNGFVGKDGADASMVVIDEDGKVSDKKRVAYENLPEEIKQQLPRG